MKLIDSYKKIGKIMYCPKPRQCAPQRKPLTCIYESVPCKKFLSPRGFKPTTPRLPGRYTAVYTTDQPGADQ